MIDRLMKCVIMSVCLLDVAYHVSSALPLVNADDEIDIDEAGGTNPAPLKNKICNTSGYCDDGVVVNTPLNGDPESDGCVKDPGTGDCEGFCTRCGGGNTGGRGFCQEEEGEMCQQLPSTKVNGPTPCGLQYSMECDVRAPTPPNPGTSGCCSPPPAGSTSSINCGLGQCT